MCALIHHVLTTRLFHDLCLNKICEMATQRSIENSTNRVNENRDTRCLLGKIYQWKHLGEWKTTLSHKDFSNNCLLLMLNAAGRACVYQIGYLLLNIKMQFNRKEKFKIFNSKLTFCPCKAKLRVILRKSDPFLSKCSFEIYYSLCIAKYCLIFIR